MVDIVPQLGAVPFTEALSFFQAKLRLPTATWTDIWQEMHSRAFVVAGAQSDALLEDFQTSLTKAMEDGLLLEDFRKDFDRIVATHGWSYRGTPGWRSKVIFQTNMRTAAAAGRWAQIQRVKAQRPYIRYVAVMDARTRPLHREWHGTVLHADDPWWDTHFPPCGWNCRCTVQSLSDRDLKRFGYDVSPAPPPSPLVTRSVNTPGGPVLVEVPKGIDPGFAYNPGKAAGAGQQLLAVEQHGQWTQLTAPGMPTTPSLLPNLKPVAIGVDLLPAAATAEDVKAALIDVLGAESKVFTDPLGARVQVGAALTDHLTESDLRSGRERYFPFIPSLIESPAEIWIGFAKSEETGRAWLRRRYIKLVTIDEAKNRALLMIVDFDGRTYSGLTFFQTELRSLNRSTLRGGVLAYRDPDQVA